MLLGVTLLGALGCADDYIYVPASHATSEVAGHPAADLPIPPEAPRGDIRLAAFGMVDLHPQAGPQGADHVRALHLRLIISDDASKAWTLDTRKQRVSLAGHGESRAAYASADLGASPPLVVIPPGDKRTVDLFFPLPADLQSEGKLPEFDIIWSVRTDSRAVTERTPFERLTVQPYAYEYDYDFWTPPYWFDPTYVTGAWYALPPAYFERPVVGEPTTSLAPAAMQPGAVPQGAR